MVDRCINALCEKTWKSFRSGEVYAVEGRNTRTEFFWLCPDCVPQFTVRLDAHDTVVPVLKTQSTYSQIPNQERDLRIVFRFSRPHTSSQFDLDSPLLDVA